MGTCFRNVGLQYEVLAHFEQSNVIVTKKAEYKKGEHDMWPLGEIV
jgi:hypothetical protein